MGKNWGFEETRRKKKIRFEINTNKKVYRANAKKRLAFMNIIDIDLFIPELINRRQDGAKANLRDSANTMGIINFRNAKNLGENDTKTNIRGIANSKKIVDFRGTKIWDSIDVDWFGPKNITPDVDPVNIK